MRIIKSVKAMQAQGLAWKRAGIRVALVPTMGSLHDGHMSLVRQARAKAGRSGKVVVSIYVNPTQFGPNEDFKRYPRDLKGDSRLCRASGVDVIFAPSDGEMYWRERGESASTSIIEEQLAHGMEGAARPGHFRGVATVVGKLFNIVLPDVAVFGAKDFQQAAVVKRMVRDLNFPLRIIVAPIFRERDGLAMSSRNRYLDASARKKAVVLSQALKLARKKVGASARPISATKLERQVRELIGTQPDARLDYVAFFDPDTLEPRKLVSRGTRMALAVRIGSTRLIDNAAL